MASDALKPFRIEVSDEQLEDLVRRLRATRWPDAETVDDWSQGIPLAYVQDVVSYWAEKYDWRDVPFAAHVGAIIGALERFRNGHTLLVQIARITLRTRIVG